MERPKGDGLLPAIWIEFVLLPDRLDEHLRQLAEGTVTQPTALELIIAFLDQASSLLRLQQAGADVPPGDSGPGYPSSQAQNINTNEGQSNPAASVTTRAGGPGVTARTAELLAKRAILVVKAIGLSLSDIEEQIPGRQHQLSLLRALRIHDPDQALVHACNIHRWKLHCSLDSHPVGSAAPRYSPLRTPPAGEERPGLPHKEVEEGGDEWNFPNHLKLVEEKINSVAFLEAILSQAVEQEVGGDDAAQFGEQAVSGDRECFGMAGETGIDRKGSESCQAVQELRVDWVEGASGDEARGKEEGEEMKGIESCISYSQADASAGVDNLVGLQTTLPSEQMLMEAGFDEVPSLEVQIKGSQPGVAVASMAYPPMSSGLLQGISRTQICQLGWPFLALIMFDVARTYFLSGRLGHAEALFTRCARTVDALRNGTRIQQSEGVASEEGDEQKARGLPVADVKRLKIAVANKPVDVKMANCSQEIVPKEQLSGFILACRLLCRPPFSSEKIHSCTELPSFARKTSDLSHFSAQPGHETVASCEIIRRHLQLGTLIRRCDDGGDGLDCSALEEDGGKKRKRSQTGITEALKRMRIKQSPLDMSAADMTQIDTTDEGPNSGMAKTIDTEEKWAGIGREDLLERELLGLFLWDTLTGGQLLLEYRLTLTGDELLGQPLKQMLMMVNMIGQVAFGEPVEMFLRIWSKLRNLEKPEAFTETHRSLKVRQGRLHQELNAVETAVLFLFVLLFEILSSEGRLPAKSGIERSQGQHLTDMRDDKVAEKSDENVQGHLLGSQTESRPLVTEMGNQGKGRVHHVPPLISEPVAVRLQSSSEHGPALPSWLASGIAQAGNIIQTALHRVKVVLAVPLLPTDFEATRAQVAGVPLRIPATLFKGLGPYVCSVIDEEWCWQAASALGLVEPQALPGPEHWKPCTEVGQSPFYSHSPSDSQLARLHCLASGEAVRTAVANIPGLSSCLAAANSGDSLVARDLRLGKEDGYDLSFDAEENLRLGPPERHLVSQLWQASALPEVQTLVQSAMVTLKDRVGTMKSGFVDRCSESSLSKHPSAESEDEMLRIQDAVEATSLNVGMGEVSGKLELLHLKCILERKAQSRLVASKPNFTRESRGTAQDNDRLRNMLAALGMYELALQVSPDDWSMKAMVWLVRKLIHAQTLLSQRSEDEEEAEDNERSDNRQVSDDGLLEKMDSEGAAGHRSQVDTPSALAGEEGSQSGVGHEDGVGALGRTSARLDVPGDGSKATAEALRVCEWQGDDSQLPPLRSKDMSGALSTVQGMLVTLIDEELWEVAETLRLQVTNLLTAYSSPPADCKPSSTLPLTMNVIGPAVNKQVSVQTGMASKPEDIGATASPGPTEFPATTSESPAVKRFEVQAHNLRQEDRQPADRQTTALAAAGWTDSVERGRLLHLLDVMAGLDSLGALCVLLETSEQPAGTGSTRVARLGAAILRQFEDLLSIFMRQPGPAHLTPASFQASQGNEVALTTKRSPLMHEADAGSGLPMPRALDFDTQQAGLPATPPDQGRPSDSVADNKGTAEKGSKKKHRRGAPSAPKHAGADVASKLDPINKGNRPIKALPQKHQLPRAQKGHKFGEGPEGKPSVKGKAPEELGARGRAANLPKPAFPGVRSLPIIPYLTNQRLLGRLAAVTAGWLHICHARGLATWPIAVERYGPVGEAVSQAALKSFGRIKSHNGGEPVEGLEEDLQWTPTVNPELCRDLLRMLVESIVGHGGTELEASDPNAHRWLLTLADFAFEEGSHAEALQLYLQAGELRSDNVCDRQEALSPQVFTPWVIRRMITSLSSLGAPLQASILCQVSCVQDYELAFRLLLDNPVIGDADAASYFDCIWEVPLLEMLIYLHAQGCDEDRVARLIHLMQQPELNAHNPPAVHQGFVQALKQRFQQRLSAEMSTKVSISHHYNPSFLWG